MRNDEWRKIEMVIKIGAFGYGLGAIFGAGAVLLAALGNSNWGTFAVIAVLLWIIPVLIRNFG